MATDFFAGCVGGCAGVVVGHPLDTVKVHMQLHGERYSGSISCLRSLVAKDSIRGLYRGVSSPMGGVALVNAVVFGIYGGVQRSLFDPDDLRSHAAAGAAAGIAQSVICSPVELAKTRMQLGCGSTGPLVCLSEIARKEGPLAIFRGLGMTAMRDAPAFSCYFASYELLSRTSDGSPAGAARVLCAGGLAGMASWIVCYPLDVIKSRVQADGLSGPRKYSGAIDCLKKSLAAEGPRFLSRGLGSVMLRAFPTNAACFGTVTWVLRLAEGREACAPTPRLDVQFGPNYAAHAYRSLLFTGAFSEAVCGHDIRDMHEDFGASKFDQTHPTRLPVPLKIGIIKEGSVNS